MNELLVSTECFNRKHVKCFQWCECECHETARKASELQHQKAECFDWEETHPNAVIHRRQGEASWFIVQWIDNKAVITTGHPTRLAAIQAAREAEKGKG